MICSVRSLAITGIQGSAVVAECYISNGLPGFDIVGLPDAAVKEAGTGPGRGEEFGAEFPGQPHHRQSGPRQREEGGHTI